MKQDHSPSPTFDSSQLRVVGEAVQIAEELTSNHFKISLSQWHRSHYDIKTLIDLNASEIDDHAFAQIVRYLGQPIDSGLGSSQFDFYKVCLQDHVILKALQREKETPFISLVVYILTHELVHIVRFNRFEQKFYAFPDEKEKEELRVHAITCEILKDVSYGGMKTIFGSFRKSKAFMGHFLDSWKEGEKRI